MKIRVKAAQAVEKEKGCVIVGIYEDGKLSESAKKIDKTHRGRITTLIKQGAFSGEVGKTLMLYPITEASSEPLLLVGCGKAAPLPPPLFSQVMKSAIQALDVMGEPECFC